MNVYGEALRLSREIGAEFGATTAEPFECVEAYLTDFEIGLCESDINKRIDPRLTMKTAKSILCFLFPYKTKHENGSADDVFLEETRHKGEMGKIVSGDVYLGMDYHFYIRNNLSMLSRRLKEQFGGEYMPFCDTGPLVDKEVAVRAGLCKYGKNSLAISEKHGSFFYIGYIITDMEIRQAVERSTNEFSEYCKNCGKCIAACPTGALKHSGMMEHEKCVSYISQKKGELTKDEARMLGDTLYGCHICQSVCSANRRYNFISYVDLENLDISNRGFKNKFGNTAMYFIGKKRFLRNVGAVLENARNRS